MSRKKTIIITALINAGLLAVLMITALSDDKEEVFLTPSSVVLEEEMKENVPIEEEKKEIVLDNTQVIEEIPIVHKLPLPDASEKQKVFPVDFFEITVRKGDSLDKLAKEYQVNVEEILKLNELSNSLIRIGQTLKMPKRALLMQKAPSEEISFSEETREYYTIKPGDNPWTIAMKHHIKLEELLRLNNLNQEKAKKLRPGDKLRIR